jgi:murein DD-endopeptidase MepM/ murein hydrolase activator NlpD
MTVGLVHPYAGTHLVSQGFTGTYISERPGWLVNDAHGPRFARRVTTAKATYHPRLHEAQDVAMPVGTNILAPQAGKIVYASTYSDGAHFLYFLIHQATSVEKYSTYFFAAHLTSGGIQVPVGHHVAQGVHIAESGASGHVTGPHLHWEVLRVRKDLAPHLATFWSQAYRYDPVRCLSTGDLAHEDWLVPNV